MERSCATSVLFDVIVEELERDWWSSYLEVLEKRFRQKEISLRATSIEML